MHCFIFCSQSCCVFYVNITAILDCFDSLYKKRQDIELVLLGDGEDREGAGLVDLPRKGIADVGGMLESLGSQIGSDGLGPLVLSVQ